MIRRGDVSEIKRTWARLPSAQNNTAVLVDVERDRRLAEFHAEVIATIYTYALPDGRLIQSTENCQGVGYLCRHYDRVQCAVFNDKPKHRIGYHEQVIPLWHCIESRLNGTRTPTPLIVPKEFKISDND